MPRGDGTRPENTRPPRTAAENRAIAEDMYVLRCSGWTVAAIAGKYECSKPNVAKRLEAHRRTLPVVERQDRRQEIDGFYQAQLRKVTDIASLGPITAYSNGRPVLVNPDWDESDDASARPEYAQDYTVVLRATELAIKITGEIRKMYGLDEATKVEQSGTVTFELVGVPLEDV